MRKLALVFALSIVLWATTASASLLTYTSESAWKDAVDTWVTEPFHNSGLQPFTGYTTDAGGIRGNAWRDRVSRRRGQSTTFSYRPGPLVGVGGMWDTSPGGQDQHLLLTVNLAGGGSQTVGEIGPIDGFFGWTSTVPFDSFRISAGHGRGGVEAFRLDNMYFASSTPPPVATPEPGTLALVGTGLTGLGILRRKWRAKRQD